MSGQQTAQITQEWKLHNYDYFAAESHGIWW